MMTLDPMPSSGGVRRPAWREPMVWLIALIPLAAVVGTLWMVFAAGDAPGTDDSVADPVRRTAQVQVADLGPDARAAALRLSAVVRLGKGVVEVLPVDGVFARDSALTLSLRHPSRAEADRVLALAPTDTGWRGEAEFDRSHDWNVQLAPADRAWRLLGRWPAGQQAAYLKPALRADEEAAANVAPAR